MSLRSPLGRVRGLGAAKEGVHHWWQQRLTAIALVPLIFWFVVSIIGNVGSSYEDMQAWLSAPCNATLLVLLVIAAFHHAQLGIQVVIEDYIHCDVMKPIAIIATKLLAFGLGTYGVVSVLLVATGG